MVFAPYRDFIDYREVSGWAADVNDVIDSLGELVDTGHAHVVVPLAEHAHRLADAAMQYIDDSDGWLSDISSRLGELHHRACRESGADPVALARRLSDLELTSELDAFHRAASTYADVLGADGLAEYRRVIEPKWHALRPETDRWSTERFRVREAMIGVAVAGGDPDDLARVKQHDLRTPDDYKEVAESLRAAGRVEDAIAWCRRGLDTYADRTWQTPPLRELLAEMLRDRGDFDGAVDAYWQAFERHPSLDAYRRLLAEAEPTDRQAEVRHCSLATLRSRVAERRPDDARARSIVTAPPASVLVEILLFEGDADGAWNAASEYGCTDRLWLSLARARETRYPVDAIPVYQREVMAQIDARKNAGYRNAVELLARIRKLAKKAGELERFEQLLREVRATHKPKRNLMALIDKKGW